MLKPILLIGLVCALGLPGSVAVEADLCVYGSTPSGIAAAVQAERMG